MKRIRNTAKKYISCRGEVNTAIMLDLVGIGDEVGLSTGLNICSKYDIISPYPIFKKLYFFPLGTVKMSHFSPFVHVFPRLYSRFFFLLLPEKGTSSVLFKIAQKLFELLTYKWADKSTTSYDRLDFKSYIKHFTHKYLVIERQYFMLN